MSCRKCNREQLFSTNIFNFNDYYWKKICECGNSYELCGDCHSKEFDVHFEFDEFDGKDKIVDKTTSKNGIKCKLCERKMKLERIEK